MSRSKHARPPGYPLSPHNERRAAVHAGVDPRLIRGWFDLARRASMRSTTAARVGEALRALGLPVDPNPEPPKAA